MRLQAFNNNEEFEEVEFNNLDTYKGELEEEKPEKIIIRKSNRLLEKEKVGVRCYVSIENM